ncbi:hypothetical protein TWF718_002087 [Orbilia javanica]|uniref:F-box domain-containing protein n=1 Tax=Orbilia javanica TaxID=47235 RepID=A0AAN8RT20_9PEZI
MSLSNLPKEIHHEILLHLDELVDQIASAAAFPLWSSLLQTKSLQATRYYCDNPNRRSSPLIHKIVRELSSQVSCVVSNGNVESYRLRFLKGSWWENPNFQDTWDISTCRFLDEPLMKPAPGFDSKPLWKVEISTISPLSWSYPQFFECLGSTTVRDFIDASTGGNINLEGYMEGEGLPPGTYQEIVLSGATVYNGGWVYSEQKGPHPKDSEIVMTTTVNIIRRSTKHYQEWMATDQHLRAAGKPVQLRSV